MAGEQATPRPRAGRAGTDPRWPRVGHRGALALAQRNFELTERPATSSRAPGLSLPRQHAAGMTPRAPSMRSSAPIASTGRRWDAAARPRPAGQRPGRGAAGRGEGPEALRAERGAGSRASAACCGRCPSPRVLAQGEVGARRARRRGGVGGRGRPWPPRRLHLRAAHDRRAAPGGQGRVDGIGDGADRGRAWRVCSAASRASLRSDKPQRSRTMAMTSLYKELRARTAQGQGEEDFLLPRFLEGLRPAQDRQARRRGPQGRRLADPGPDGARRTAASRRKRPRPARRRRRRGGRRQELTAGRSG